MASENELVLYGTVGESFWDEEYFTAADVRRQLAAMTGPVTVRLNSGGGIADQGQAIYTALKDYPGEVTVVVDGVAASAASLIAMAADRIRMRLGAWMLIHDPGAVMTGGRGTEDDHRRTADMLSVIGDAYAEVYAARAGITREEARRIMRAETVLDGAAAVAMGFADEHEGSAAAAAAAFDYRIYANAPADLKAASERLGRTRDRAAVLAMIAGQPRMSKGEPSMAAEPMTAAEATPAATEVTMMAAPVTAAQPAPGAAAPADPAAAVRAERERVRRIMAAAEVAGVPGRDVQAMVDEGLSFEAAHDRIVTLWSGQGGDDLPRPGRATARILRDERDTMRAGMTSALVAQMARSTPDHEAGRGFMCMSLAEMAAQAVGRGTSLRNAGDRADVLMAAFHTTSDFPAVLENALNRRLLAGYQMATPTYQQVAIRVDFTDFRPHPMTNIGTFPLLERVPEAGEIAFGTLGDKKETVTLQAFGRGLALSRQMIVNDDLSAIDRVVTSTGLAVARTEDNVFWSMVLSGANADGPTLTETGRQVFNTTDGTKAGAAAAITVASVGLGRAAIQKQKGLNGEDLGLTPSILLVGPDKLTEAEQLVATIQPQSTTAVNPFSGRLTVISTPKITGNAWYLMTAPAVQPAFMYGFLSGDEGPRVRMEEPFGMQGVRYTCERDFGAGGIDFRGVYKNAGA